MTRRLLFLSLLLLALPAFSQTGDLRVSIDSDTRIPSSAPTFNYVVHVAWDGAQPAQNVVLDINVPGTVHTVYAHGDGTTCTQAPPVRCTIPQLTKDDLFSGATVSVGLPGAGTYTATATVSTSSPEAPASNNTATHTLEVAALPSLFISGSGTTPAVALDANEEGTVRVGVMNSGDPATHVVFRVAIEDGVALSAEPEAFSPAAPTTCVIENGEAVCTAESMGFQGYSTVSVHYRAPNRRNGGSFDVVMRVDANEPDFNPADNASRLDVVLRRMFDVTSAADDGSGSLRQTILDANAQCALPLQPCTISLAGVAGVQPSSPLPAITGYLRVDGGTRRAEIDGSRLASGDGLVIDGACQSEVRNLVIRNFPHHAIEARQTAQQSNACGYSLGYATALLVSKTELVHNERGVVTKGVDATLSENVIHENRRSGVFLDGAWYSHLNNNVIVNNGASGVFVNNGTFSRFTIPSGTELIENVIHGNAEFGIARTRNGLVAMTRNSLVRNGVYAYDVDLDLASANRDPEAGGVPNRPELISAAYDPANNVTIVRGVVNSRSGSQLDFYASDSRDARGGPQAERWLKTDYAGLTWPNFEVWLPGDLRGQWITATSTKSVTLYFLRTDKVAPAVSRPSSGQDTSELSEPRQVQ